MQVNAEMSALGYDVADLCNLPPNGPLSDGATSDHDAIEDGDEGAYLHTLHEWYVAISARSLPPFLPPSFPPSLPPSSRAHASLTAHTQHHKLCECVARHRRRVLAPYVHHQAHMSGVQRPDSRVTAPLDMQSQETHVERNGTIFCTERAVFVLHDGGMSGKKMARKRDSLSGAECARAREREINIKRVE